MLDIAIFDSFLEILPTQSRNGVSLFFVTFNLFDETVGQNILASLAIIPVWHLSVTHGFDSKGVIDRLADGWLFDHYLFSFVELMSFVEEVFEVDGIVEKVGLCVLGFH